VGDDVADLLEIDGLDPRPAPGELCQRLDLAVIAGRLGLSVSGVKSRVQRGRELLRQMLERCCQIALDARGAPMGCELKPDADVPPGCCTNGCAAALPVVHDP
jgi:hypothetical protein